MCSENAGGSPLDESTPDDLLKCERQLSHIHLPSPQLSRDHVLYRAGWEAALQRSASGLAAHLVDGPVGRTNFATHHVATFGWSLASAIMASWLTAAFLWRTSDDGRDVVREVTEQPHTQVSSAIAGAAPVFLPDEATASDAWAVSSGRPRFRNYAPSARLLVARERAMWKRWDDPWVPTADAPTSKNLSVAPVLSVKSSHELLKELSPGHGQL